MSGKIVVTPRTGPLAAFVEKTAPTVKLVVTKDYEESLTRLVRGEADAAALNYHVGTHLAARLYPGRVVHSPIAVSRAVHSRSRCRKVEARTRGAAKRGEFLRFVPMARGKRSMIAGRAGDTRPISAGVAARPRRRGDRMRSAASSSRCSAARRRRGRSRRTRSRRRGLS